MEPLKKETARRAAERFEDISRDGDHLGEYNMNNSNEQVISPTCRLCGFVRDDRCIVDGYYIHDSKPVCSRYWNPTAEHKHMDAVSNEKMAFIKTVALAVAGVDRKRSAVEYIKYHNLPLMCFELVEIRFATCSRSIWINVTGTSCGWILKDIWEAIYGAGIGHEIPDEMALDLIEKELRARGRS